MHYRELHTEAVNLVWPGNRGLVSWWLNLPGRRGGGGSTFRDLMGRNDGTLINMDSSNWVGAKGRPGGWGALDFDGSSDYVTLGETPTFISDTQGSISGWFRLDSLFSSNGNDKLFGYGGQGATEPGLFALEVRRVDSVTSGATRVGVIYRTDGSGASLVGIVGSTDLVAGIWYNFCLTGSGSSYALYVNGVSETLNVWIGTNDGKWIGDTTVTAPGDVSIGSLLFDGSRGAYFTGDVDNIHMFNRVLSNSGAFTLYSESKAAYPNALNWHRTVGFAPSTILTPAPTAMSIAVPVPIASDVVTALPTSVLMPLTLPVSRAYNQRVLATVESPSRVVSVESPDRVAAVTSPQRKGIIFKSKGTPDG